MEKSATYDATRNRVEHYFDRSATKVWERLTSDAPVSGVRATVRAGRDRMRDLMLAQLPTDLRGARVLDAGCGTGAMAVELATRGADVVAVDISPELIKIAEARCPDDLRDKITFASGDMLNPELGSFDHALAMDSMIYYGAESVARMLAGVAPRITTSMIFTLAPRTPLLMTMWRVGKMFPSSDRSPSMIPESCARVSKALSALGAGGTLREVERVNSGFYISTALEFRP
ncbi:MAG: magnesium protoporphyrin IX methyltransferase [Roseovarius sp.]